MRKRRNPLAVPSRRRRFSPLSLIGVVASLVVILVGGVVFLLPRMLTHAADAQPNMDCTLIVPREPLTAQGLATPYQLTATHPANGPCNEANPNQAVFVQGAVIDPATGKISIYNPLVIDKGTRPAIAPVVPQLPRGGIVALWGGGNDNNTTLQSTNDSLQGGRCVNGTRNSIFGQVWFCNTSDFFRTANRAMETGKLKPPALGTAKDGQPCPTVRDFSVVDQDQSDNVTTDYLVLPDGRTAQATAANAAALPKATSAANGSDNKLLASFIDNALGCTPWMAPDLADKGHLVPAQPLNELQAAMYQAQPVALVPNNDPMVLINGKLNLTKLNAYRQGVDQPFVWNQNLANTRTYCTNLRGIGAQRLLLDAPFTLKSPSLAPSVGNTLFTFLAARFSATYGDAAPGLNCQALIHQPDPVQVKTDQNGVAISATIDGVDATQNQSLGCNVNGTVLADCTGSTTINGGNCTFQLDMTTKQVKITCAPPKGIVTPQN
ncbi:MAG: hypothetical protein ABI234_00400 [Ktedonobacteraceae bacterium]